MSLSASIASRPRKATPSIGAAGATARRQHCHAEALGRDPGQRAADRAEADDADRPAADLDRGVGVSPRGEPALIAQVAIDRPEAPRQHERRHHGVFRDGAGIAAGQIRHQNAGGGGRVDRYHVNAGTMPDRGAQARGSARRARRGSAPAR